MPGITYPLELTNGEKRPISVDKLAIAIDTYGKGFGNGRWEDVFEIWATGDGMPSDQDKRKYCKAMTDVLLNDKILDKLVASGEIENKEVFKAFVQQARVEMGVQAITETKATRTPSPTPAPARSPSPSRDDPFAGFDGLFGSPPSSPSRPSVDARIPSPVITIFTGESKAPERSIRQDELDTLIRAGKYKDIGKIISDCYKSGQKEEAIGALKNLRQVLNDDNFKAVVKESTQTMDQSNRVRFGEDMNRSGVLKGSGQTR